MVMIDLDDICSLSDFQRRTREHIRRLRATGRPEVLTVNGRAALVVHDAASYQEIVNALERARTLPAFTSTVPDVLEPDPVVEDYKQHVDRTLLRENLRRTVEQRVANLVALQALTFEARRAGEAARRRSRAAGGGKVGQ
jgi:PHD/YefM family antitoxin component YafN of YafNO toxin-antitoxin module